ncbi:DUF5682 family protein [uncultured Tateyamaria sp.]|uniref:DUF5682 family protein n=1 Tax=uncultured Tateyamaria sp. TaxID=455651 RepID=UPI002620A07E|nr:DUF5682 family protein [uncultured Tateyamaria sp.]
MTDRATLAQLRGDLFQADRGLYVVPIRHHSPACAWALSALISEVKPSQVLIEAPADFSEQIPLLLDPDTKPPVALVALLDDAGDRGRVAGYYPFCAHSPEYVAMQAGTEIGASLKFIDAPAATKAMWGQLDGTEPKSLLNEERFNANDYVDALTRATGCRDGFELWDHLFETRLAQPDWRGFFGDVGVYCAGIRAATPAAQIDSTGDTMREAHMARAVKMALAAGGPVVVVVGGFHAPALVGDLDNMPAPRKPDGTCESYLIRYGFQAMDALNGYAAGLPQPGYYQALWDRANTDNAHDLGIDLLTGFATRMRGEGHALSVPAQIEAMRMAQGLAALRGRSHAMRHDLIDGVRAALIKGETATQDIWTTRFQAFLCGDRLGDVPPSAGSPPLVEDVRRRARAHRLDLSDSAQRVRKLDIRRKDSHLAASRFFHALGLIGSPFAQCTGGPDYLSGAQTALLFEHWQYAWSPQTEGHLIDQAVLGDELPTACLAFMHRERAALIANGQGRDLPQLVDLLVRGLLAGLGAQLDGFLVQLGSDIQNYGTFASVTVALRRLLFVVQSSGPLGAPETLDLRGVVGAAYGRLIYLCDDLPNTSEEDTEDRLDALRMMNEVLRDCDGIGLDRSLLDTAMDRVALATTNPVILGAILAVCVQAGTRPAAELAQIMEGRLTGVSLDTSDRIGVLRGILHTSPPLLWHADGLLEVVDRFIRGIDEDMFLELLPHLRLAFTRLNPRETDRVAHELAGLLGVQASGLIRHNTQVSDADLADGLRIEKALRASLETDALSNWITGEVSQ